MSNQPLQDDRPTTLTDVLIQMAVLTEKVGAMEKRSNNTVSYVAIIISVLVLLLNFGTKLNWA